MVLTYLLIGFNSGDQLILLILFLGISAAMVPGIVFALPPQVLGASFAAIGFGIEGTIMNIGAAVAQPAVGFVMDNTVSYIYPFITMAGFAAAGAIIAFTLKSR